MKVINKANIVYFSGTGGTELAARTLEAELARRGVSVAVKSISVNDNSVLPPADTMFLMYPVHAGDASEAVYEFIDSLESLAIPLTDAVVLSVSAGGEMTFNTASRSKVIRRLMKKGFVTVYEDMIVMLNNFARAFSDKLTAMVMYALPYKIREIADSVLSGIIRRKNPKASDSVLRTIAEPFKLYAKASGKFLRANESCTGCGLCAAECPRGNIKLEENFPVFGWKCVMCMKCVYACPESAITSGQAKLIKVKGGFDINFFKKLGENCPGLNDKDILSETEGGSMIGVREYLLAVSGFIRNINL